MNQYTEATKTYIATYKKELVIGAAVIFGPIAVITAIALILYYSNPSRVVYQPAKACDMLTPAKAPRLAG